MIKQDSMFSTADVTQSERALHTPGIFAKQNLLYVQEVGRLQSLKPHRCIREKLESFLFLVVLEGKGSLEINGNHYDLEQGHCALIDCMEHYEHISDAEHAWKLAWVHFNGHNARAYYDLFCRYNRDSNVFQTENVACWNEQIGSLLEQQTEKGILSELLCGEKLLGLLNQVIACVADKELFAAEDEKQMVNDMREYLNEEYADRDVLKMLGQKFGQSPETLDSIFYQRLGIHIREYVSNRRLNAAKELLRFSIKSVDEIAVEAGMEDLDAMQQLFRTQEGMTAEEYRMKWAQWVR